VTREEFITQKWQTYPSLPTRSSDFILGRVSGIEENEIKLVRNGQVQSCERAKFTPHVDKQLGNGISPHHLVIGDVVAYNINEAGFYLLSPRLNVFEEFNYKKLIEWTLFINRVRNIFMQMNFLETPTPYLVETPGVDHHIEFFEVKGSQTNRSWYLPTSPEINLKKYLCHGLDKIFEIKNCFRDDLNSPTHRPEFTMIEWYRAYENLEAIKLDVKQLLNNLTQKELVYKELSISECFNQFLNFNLKSSTTDIELKNLAQKFNIDLHPSDDWNDIYFRIFIEKIEPQLAQFKNPIFLTSFPRQQASLSKINQDGWSERFELYWNGIELANAYLEVNDPSENLKVFEAEKAKREKDFLKVAQIDENFINELKLGMPPSSGIALGLNRLHMVISGGTKI
jgi:elongation factor P--(R)-beta-lysine ligase